MKLRQIAAAVALAAGLAGCFTSDKPLISDADSATPFKKITFGEPNAKEPSVATLDGKGYLVKEKDGTLSLRFKAVDTDLYLAEMSAKDKEGKPQRLYGLIKLDRAANTAGAYKIMASKDDFGPGLRDCKDDTICIDDVNAYIALAKKAMAAATKPDVVYKLKLE